MSLKRYWFEFDRTGELPPGVRIGCGVTAEGLDDARRLISKRIFNNVSQPSITRIVEDVDVSTLDKGHVLPNMGIPIARGIWFPLGY